MTTIAEHLADDLAQAYAHGPEAVTGVFGANLAAHVEIVHRPPQPQDGTYDRELLLNAQKARVAEFARVLTGYREEAAVSTLADEITVELTISGTFADGTAVTMVGTDRLTLTNGEITRMESAFESDQMDALVSALVQN